MIAWIITFVTLAAFLWLANRGAAALLPPLCHPILLRDTLDARERAIFVAADELPPEQASAIRRALVVVAALRSSATDHNITERNDLLDRCQDLLEETLADRDPTNRSAIDDLRNVTRRLWMSVPLESVAGSEIVPESGSAS